MALGAFAVGSACPVAASLGKKPLSLPPGAWLLKRRLQRGLRDGLAISVTREWRVQFARQSRGIAVSGAQVSVAVDAPERLAPIAKIEEQRSSDAMFPILLAPNGKIIAAGQNTSQESLDEAVRAGTALLAEEMPKAMAGARPAAQHARYLAQLQQSRSSLLDELPGDLFYPSAKPFRAVRQIALPDGRSGEFAVNWEASAHNESGWLNTARREVITRIGESERRSSEDWSLKAL